MDTGKAKRFARSHAQREGLAPPPKDPTRTERFGPTCYALKGQGFTWKEVALQAGMKWNTHACTAARKHAEKNNLPWPVALIEKENS